MIDERTTTPSLAYAQSRPDAAHPRMPLAVLWFYLVTCVAAELFGLVQPMLAIDPVIIQLNQFGPAVGVLAVLLAWRRWRPPLATGFGLSREVLVRLVVAVLQERSRLGVLIIAGGFHMLVNIGVQLLTGDSGGDAVQLSLIAACLLTVCGVLLVAAWRGIALTGVVGGDRA